MSNENLNESSVDETAFLYDMSNDPPLNAVHIGLNDGLNDPNQNGSVENEQLSIQDLAQRMDILTRQLQSRDAVLFERISTLEQNSSRGSQLSTASIAAARPENNRFGVTLDRSGGNSTQNAASAAGDSPSYSNLTAPSAVNSNSSGPGADSRQRSHLVHA